MLWPIVLVFLCLWLLGLILDISGAYVFLLVAAILMISILLMRPKASTR
jgi:hypothetical protein